MNKTQLQLVATWTDYLDDTKIVGINDYAAAQSIPADLMIDMLIEGKRLYDQNNLIYADVIRHKQIKE